MTAQLPSEIRWFTGEYAFLFNFHPSPFEVTWDEDHRSRENGEFFYGYRQTHTRRYNR